MAVSQVPKRFALNRKIDASGVSGTGLVAYGVRWSDGTCVIRWGGDFSSTTVFNSLEDLASIHGHSGMTEILWFD